jgi:hypothetical protein
VEEKIEHLCRTFEDMKPYLKAQWNDLPVPPTSELIVGENND